MQTTLQLAKKLLAVTEKASEGKLLQKANSFFELIKKYIAVLMTGKILGTIIAVIIGFFLLKLIDKLLKKNLVKTKIDPVLHGIIRQSIKFVGYAILMIIVGQNVFGMNQSNITAIIGTFGLALSLSIKDTTSNMASGIIILANKYFKIGDYIEIGTITGIVSKVTLDHVKLLTPNKTEIYVPNSIITKTSVINHSRQPFRRVEMRATLGSYMDIEVVKENIIRIINNSKMLEIYKDTDGITDQSDPIVSVLEFTENDITYMIKFWTSQENYNKAYYYVNEEIKKWFDWERKKSETKD